ncbi:MAG: hypothetical protein ABI562_06260 [Chloroflexota bacterium]
MTACSGVTEAGIALLRRLTHNSGRYILERTGVGMRLLGRRARAVVMILIGLSVGGGLAPTALAPRASAAVPDRSEVVLVFDFSASILNDKANRNRFGAALEGIAARVEATSADLVAGDATVSIVQFAAKAIDYPGCAELRLIDSPQTVTTFAGCLRSLAGAYRKGLAPALTRQIGIDTNYVAAMEQAATHLPADAARPVLILFSDGKHDVKGVPVSQVQVVHDRLFGTRTPVAVLPVGMGLAAKDRAALEAGLVRLRVIRDMPPCISGTTFEWPQVVFQTADQAGSAVAVALQDATCTFTVAPLPSATPKPVPGAVRAFQAATQNGNVDLTWAAPATTEPIVDYLARCRAGEGDWVESTEGVSILTRARIEGMPVAPAYDCEVAAVGASGAGPWTPATATQLVPPDALAKPAVGALDKGVEITVAPPEGALISGFHYECSPDNGQTWPAGIDVTSPSKTTVLMGKLTNGVSYVCRAFAENAAGRGAASPVSDTVRPCSGLLECNPIFVPILGVLGALLLVGLALVVLTLLRARSRGYVLAVVDVVHRANLGHGSTLGIKFARDPATKRVTELVAAKPRDADVRIQNLGRGLFIVRDARGRHEAKAGEPVIIVDSLGSRHELVLWAFATNSATPVSVSR